MEVEIFLLWASSLIFGLLTFLPLVRPQTPSTENLRVHFDCGTGSNDSVPQSPPSVLRWTVSSIPCAILCLNAISGNCASFSWNASTCACTLHSTETSRCSFAPGTQLAVTIPQSLSSTMLPSPPAVTTTQSYSNTAVMNLTNTWVAVTPVQGPTHPPLSTTNIPVQTSTTMAQPSQLVTVATIQDVASTSVLTTIQGFTSTTALPILLVNVTTNNASSCPSIVCFENSRLSTIINIITSINIQDCYDACAANISCTGFSQYNDNSTCTMYSSILQTPVTESGYTTCYCKKNIVQNQTFTPSCVSDNFGGGEYKMTTTTPTGSKCFICKCNYVFYMGNNNGVFFIPAAIPDFDTCRSFCSDSSSCPGFAYREQDRSCQLTPSQIGTEQASQAVYCTANTC